MKTNRVFNLSCHTDEGRCLDMSHWIPAYAGMTTLLIPNADNSYKLRKMLNTLRHTGEDRCPDTSHWIPASAGMTGIH